MVQNKIKHLIFLRDKLLTGTPISSKSSIELVEEEFGEYINLRTAQRYISDLKDLIPYCIEYKDNQKVQWVKLESDYINNETYVSPFANDNNYLLSLNVLKAHLGTFKNTSIENDVDKLISKINKESSSDENLVSTDSLYWEQNFGQFDYSVDENHSKVIKEVMKQITDKRWSKVNYQRIDGKISSFNCLFREFFYYSGTLYVATYNPYYNHHIAMAIQSIIDIKKPSSDELINLNKENVPEFDFKEFTKNRFGVFHGNVEKVILVIDKDSKRYFRNRNYHQSQVVFNDNNDNEDMIIRMEVPLSPELVSWILSWGGAIRVKEPSELITRVREKIQLLKNSIA